MVGVSGASAPTGTVGFASSPAGGSFGSSGSCTLQPTGANSTLSCAVTFTSSAASLYTISTTYSGDGTYSSDTASTTVAVVGDHASSEVVKCAPAHVVVGRATKCTATVKDAVKGTKVTPTGTVSFSSTGGGSLSDQAQCVLVRTSSTSARCSLIYTPSAVGSGTHTVTATYSGDGTYMPVTASATVSVGLRSASTGLVCSPTKVAIGRTTTCAATVTDTSTGTKQAPTGTASFSTNSQGSFSNGATCTLVEASNSSAKCSLVYSPTAPGTQTITAKYNGDTTHLASDASKTLTVT